MTSTAACTTPMVNMCLSSHHADRRFGAEDVEILEQLARIGAAALVGLDRARVEGALVALQREVKARTGVVELRGLQPAVRGVIELTRLDRVFALRD